VSKVNVSLVRCDSYNAEEVDAAIRRSIGLLGGWGAHFRPGEHIVLKPNILSGTDPALCVVTHPSLFEWLVKGLKAYGVRLSYGDSPAVGASAKHVRKAGYAGIAESLGIPLADFDDGKTVTHPGARVRGSFPIANGVLEADGLVDICKLKTHGLVRLTGAVKNQLGCLPGLAKVQSHARLPLPADFAAFLVDINTFVRPRLHVMDAVYAMEGNGPNSGDPKKLGVILMSTDPVALDAVACRIVDIDPTFVPTCVAGARAGLGTFRAEEIEVVGERLDGFVDRSFKIVRKPPVAVYGTGLGRVVKNALAPRPRVRRRLCTRCGRCVDVCPVKPKAFHWQGNAGSQPPRHESQRCIRCFCCQETCPDRAIAIETPIAGKVAPVVASGVIQITSRISRAGRWMKSMKWVKKSKGTG
jgi:uncharacterized protein (DUF362 family)/Pyruvate/2-oxoacid:ferredoxin oxidoreductase delta subunit